ncbi:MAG: hypothetical protein LCI00_22770 [Chloroflexi bacterium]|nr:hypothetical protein [Chloroflexota bacterium]MCC6893195.1 hypothetical protein [Anaerolineae bacterium]
MTKAKHYPVSRPYVVYAFWGLHTLMLAFFLLLEAAGFKMPVGSSIFYFTWIAIWLMHGCTLMLGRVRQRESADGDAEGSAKRYWRRMVLAAHSSLFMAFGPAIFLWWLMVRPPGPRQPGEGQGFWIYPIWLMILLAHSGYVMWRERDSQTRKPEKRKRDLSDFSHLTQTDEASEALHDHFYDEDDIEPYLKRG